MTDADVAISLAIADGRARLTVGRCDLGAAVVERVQVIRMAGGRRAAC